MITIGAKLVRLFVLFCLLLSSTPLALSQTTTTGAVNGRVHLAGTPDRGVPGATIILRDEESGGEKSAASDANGDYYFSTLRPGDYTITVTAPGYESRSIAHFQVRLSKTTTVIPPIGLQSTTVAVTPP